MSLPLHGCTVIDMTRVLAGPYCTMILRNLGARVIKVEKPPFGDDSRRIGPFIRGKSAYFASLNRGKESIALDLTQAEHRAIFDGLLSIGDVLVENARPGALARHGYDDKTIERKFPHLIYASISGFGQDGAYGHRPSYDLIAQAMGGVMHLNRQQDGIPTRVGVSIGDITAGLYAVIGILAALQNKKSAGRRVDISMLDCQVAILEGAIARFDASGQEPTPTGSRHPTITPFDVFETKDKLIAIAAGNDALFAKLAHTLERRDWLDDQRFHNNEQRTQHHESLKRDIEDVLKQQSRDYWLEKCLAENIPVAPINTITDVMNDPQIRHRQMIMQGEDPIMGETHVVGDPIKLTASDSPSDSPPGRTEHAGRALASPELDADREHILRALTETLNKKLPS